MRLPASSAAAATSLLLPLFGLALLPGAVAAGAPSSDLPRHSSLGPEVVRTAADLARGDSARVIVTFKAPGAMSRRPDKGAIRTARDAVLAGLPEGGHDVVSAYRRIPAVALEADAVTLTQLDQDPRVLSVQEDHVLEATMTEANQVTGANGVHDEGITGAGLTVAIIDTGVDSAGGVVHSGLADDLAGQQCFRTENDCPGGADSAEDQDGHGTHVAGIITGPEGVAPDADFYALKVFTTGDTTDTNVLNALDHVIGLNSTTPGTVDLVNLSLGGEGYANAATCNADNPAYQTAFATLNSQSVTVFASTGNDASTTGVGAPACVDGAVGVGSTGDATFTVNFSVCTDRARADKVSCFSNATSLQGTGELVDLLAPGCYITSLGLNGASNVSSCGTSMATPYAAGAAALVQEYAEAHDGKLGPADLEALLEETGKPVLDYRISGSPSYPRVAPAAAIDGLVSPALQLSTSAVVVQEGEGGASYTARLTTAPTAEVTVTPVGDDDCSVSPASLTFTLVDFASPQSITVTAPDDGIVEATEQCTITHTLVSTDPAYDALTAPSVTGAVTDAVTDATEPVVPEPGTGTSDVRIAKPGPVVGNDVYGGTSQKKVLRAAVGQKVTYVVSLQNDGTVTDRLKVLGRRSGDGFKVRYLGPGGTNITRSVVAGTFRTPGLAVGQTYAMKVVATVGTKAEKKLKTSVLATSETTASAADVVFLLTKRT